MDIESLRNYCLSLPGATEDMPFGPDYLVFRVGGKIFACLPLTGLNIVQMKCDPDYSVALRDQHSAIEPAWHWNKRHWIQFPYADALPDPLIRTLIHHSHNCVVSHLPRKIRQQILEK